MRTAVPWDCRPGPSGQKVAVRSSAASFGVGVVEGQHAVIRNADLTHLANHKVPLIGTDGNRHRRVQFNSLLGGDVSFEPGDLCARERCPRNPTPWCHHRCKSRRSLCRCWPSHKNSLRPFVSSVAANLKLPDMLSRFDGRVTLLGHGVDTEQFATVFVSTTANDQRVLVDEHQTQWTDVELGALAVDINWEIDDHILGLAAHDANNSSRATIGHEHVTGSGLNRNAARIVQALTTVDSLGCAEAMLPAIAVRTRTERLTNFLISNSWCRKTFVTVCCNYLGSCGGLMSGYFVLLSPSSRNFTKSLICWSFNLSSKISSSNCGLATPPLL